MSAWREITMFVPRQSLSYCGSHASPRQTSAVSAKISSQKSHAPNWNMPCPQFPPSSRDVGRVRSEEHTSELQSLMRISYAVFCLKKKNNKTTNTISMHQYT